MKNQETVNLVKEAINLTKKRMVFMTSQYDLTRATKFINKRYAYLQELKTS